MLLFNPQQSIMAFGLFLCLRLLIFQVKQVSFFIYLFAKEDGKENFFQMDPFWPIPLRSYLDTKSLRALQEVDVPYATD